MKKQTSSNFSKAASTATRNVKNAGSKARKFLSKTKRYIYTEQDLGEGMLHMGITAATYVALSASY